MEVGIEDIDPLGIVVRGHHFYFANSHHAQLQCTLVNRITISTRFKSIELEYQAVSLRFGGDHAKACVNGPLVLV